MKNNLWSGVAVGSLAMSLTKMPYPIIFVAFSLAIIIFLYYIIKENIKKGWAYFGILISIFMGYIFLLINRTIEEFKILSYMEKPSFFTGVFFIVIMYVMIFISAKPEIKKAGGFANYMEDRQPGSWMMMKIGLWILIICAIFVAITFI